MQADGKDIVDTRVLQVGVEFTSLPLGLRRLLVAYHGKDRHHLVHARHQRARHVGAQHQQFGHALRRDHRAIDLAVDLEAGHRAQHRGPVVEIVLLAVGIAVVAARGLELDVEDPRGIVGALQEGAQPHEVEGIVLEHGAELHATSQVRAELDPFEKARRVFPEHAVGDHALHVEPGGVDGFPDFGGQRAAHRARVLAGRAQAAHDRRHIGHVAHHEVDHIVARQQAVLMVEGLRQLRDIEHGPPALLGHLGRLRQQRGLVVDVEHARGVFRALGVAGHPEQVVGGTAQHVGSPRMAAAVLIA
ncbi:hypothetical protein D3C81_1335810 [compost metagenome]